MINIQGFEGKYGITKLGKVWSYPFKWRYGSHKGKWLRKNKTHCGYLTVPLQVSKKSKTFLVHRLVAQAYIPNPLNLKQVNHKNGIKTDNRVKNLEWVTPSQNQLHSARIGLMVKGVAHHNAKLFPEAVIDIRNNIKIGVRHRGIIFFAEKYGVDKKCISQVITRKTWKDI